MQSAVAHARAYGQVAASIIRRVAPSQEAQTHPYFKQARDSKKLYIVFTSDRGQAGAFNSNVLHATTSAMQENDGGSSVIVFGKKGARFFSHLSGINLLGAYQDIADTPESNIFAPVLETLENGFEAGDFSSVELVYTEFISALSQKVKVSQLLPISLPEDAPEEENHTVYEFEPNLEAVLEEALRLYFESQLMQARIESAASEHAMRMVAMGNANRNAGDLIDTLTLELNATRQAAITQEIAEITGGAAAIAT
jgi:F-type H+-transporting ATPase subunit gamma